MYNIQNFSSDHSGFSFFKLTAIHIIVVILTGIICYPLIIVPGEFNEVAWDIGWYYSIVRHGYHFSETELSSVAFFPLFPYTWKLLKLDFLSCQILNGITFLAGSFLLYKIFKPKWILLLYSMAVPSAFFYFVPYSESFFYLFGAFILIGFYKKNPYLIISGLFLSILTRSAASTFIPALVITGLIEYFIHKKN